MKRIGLFSLLLVFIFALQVGGICGATSATPQLSVDAKSGNEIVVSWANISQSTIGSNSVSVQIRRRSDSGTGSSLAYHYVYNTTTNNGVDGTVTFSSAYAGDEARKANFPLADGEYYAILRKDNGSLIQESRVDFVVGRKPTLTLEAETYTQGNEIKVSWENVSVETIGSPSVSIQIRRQSDAGSGTSLAYHYIYNTSINNGTSGSVTFSAEYAGSEDRKANFPLSDGGYYVILRTDNGSLIQESRVDFAVAVSTPGTPPEPTSTPEISLSKLEFELGEDILVSYTGMNGAPNLVIRLYKSGYTVGKTVSEAYVIMTDATGNALHDETGTIIFIQDDERPAGDVNKVESLAAGNYTLVLVVNDGSNTVCGEPIEFVIKETPTQTGDSSLMTLSITLVLCVSACVLVKRKVSRGEYN